MTITPDQLNTIAWQQFDCTDEDAPWCRQKLGRRCLDRNGDRTSPHKARRDAARGFAKRQPEVDALMATVRETSDQLARTTQANTQLVAQIGDLELREAQAVADRDQARTELATAQTRIEELEAAVPPAPDPDPTPDPPTRVTLPFGFGINDEPDNGPAGSPAGITLYPLEDAAGVKLDYARGYFEFDAVKGADKPMVDFATRHLGEGRIPLITAKVPGNDWVGAAAGKYDTAVAPTAEAYMALVDKYGGQVVQGIHHEPVGDGTPANWRAMQAHYLPLIQIPGAVQQWATLEGYAQFVDAAETTWTAEACWVPGIDGYLFDPYLSFWQKPNNNTKITDMVKTYLDPFAKWAAEHDVQWGIAETGMTEVAATKTNTQIPTWWVDFCAAARARGAGPVTYWNRFSDKGNDYRLTTTKPGDKRGQMVAAMRAARA